jgi:hypothetical protein
MMAHLLLMATARVGLRPHLEGSSHRMPAGSVRMLAAPSRKIDSFQTVSVACSKCDATIFSYKKKNGLKSSLVKCFVERITDDPFRVLNGDDTRESWPVGKEWTCPGCGGSFARSAFIRGRPALKLIGGKVRMRK